jgi:hypothetical protein
LLSFLRDHQGCFHHLGHDVRRGRSRLSLRRREGWKVLWLRTCTLGRCPFSTFPRYWLRLVHWEFFNAARALARLWVFLCKFFDAFVPGW